MSQQQAALIRARALIGAPVMNRHSGRVRVVTDVRMDADRRRTRKLERQRQGLGGPGHESYRMVVELDGRLIVSAQQFSRNWEPA